MSLDLNCGRLCDASVKLADGRSINLADFRGRKLIAFFCPQDDPGAVREILAYEAMAAFAAHPKMALAAIRAGIKPARSGAPDATLDRLFTELDSRTFAVRDRAAPVGATRPCGRE